MAPRCGNIRAIRVLGEHMVMNYRAARVSKRQRAMLDFAVKLTASPGSVEEGDRERLRRAGFSDRDIWDISAVAGFFNTNGVRSLDVSCWQCHHRTILSADPWPDHVPVPSFGPRMVCTRCGIIGADARPNWQEQPQRESLTGVQWR